MKFKKDDVVKVVDEYVSHPYNLEYGSVHVVNDVAEMGTVNVGVDGQYWSASRFVLMKEADEVETKYAAAFNVWMDEYVNNPQLFETSYDMAMRHVSQKLGGYEPSYGEVAAEQFKQYLENVRS